MKKNILINFTNLLFLYPYEYILEVLHYLYMNNNIDKLIIAVREKEYYLKLVKDLADREYIKIYYLNDENELDKFDEKKEEIWCIPFNLILKNYFIKSGFSYKYINKNYSKILSYFSKTEQYLLKIIRENKINNVILFIETHYLNYLIYWLALKLNINIIFINYGKLEPYTLTIWDKNLCADVSKRCDTKYICKFYSRISKSNKPLYAWLFDKIIFLQSIFSIKLLPRRIINLLRYIKYYYTRNKYEKITVMGISWLLKNLLFSEILKILKKNIYKLFYTKDLDFSEKIIFFPLHDDEDAYYLLLEKTKNQIELARRIALNLPKDFILVIKLHPHTFNPWLNIRDLISLLKYPNVILADTSFSPIELIKKSELVITLNSTTWYEALLLNKPVITFWNNELWKLAIKFKEDEIDEKLFCFLKNKEYLNINFKEIHEKLSFYIKNTVKFIWFTNELVPIMNNETIKQLADLINKYLK